MKPSEALMASSSLSADVSICPAHQDHPVYGATVIMYRPQTEQVLMQLDGKKPEWYVDAEWTVVENKS